MMHTEMYRDISNLRGVSGYSEVIWCRLHVIK